MKWNISSMGDQVNCWFVLIHYYKSSDHHCHYRCHLLHKRRWCSSTTGSIDSGAWKRIKPVDETSSTEDGWTIDMTVLLGLHFSIVWNTELTEIRVMVASPKRPFGLPRVNLVWVLISQLPKPSPHHYFHRIYPKSCTHYSTYSSSPVPSETTPCSSHSSNRNNVGQPLQAS
jgi:hypothetical protein